MASCKTGELGALLLLLPWKQKLRAAISSAVDTPVQHSTQSLPVTMSHASMSRDDRIGRISACLARNCVPCACCACSCIIFTAKVLISDCYAYAGTLRTLTQTLAAL